jgi:hypothetical protein
MHRIATLGTEQECTAVSQHQCQNAFANIEIGDPLYKIFGSLPTDPMHSICKHKCFLASMFYQNIGPSSVHVFHMYGVYFSSKNPDIF